MRRLALVLLGLTGCVAPGALAERVEGQRVVLRDLELRRTGQGDLVVDMVAVVPRGGVSPLGRYSPEDGRLAVAAGRPHAERLCRGPAELVSEHRADLIVPAAHVRFRCA